MTQMQQVHQISPNATPTTTTVTTVWICFTMLYAMLYLLPPNPFHQSLRTLSCGATRRSNGAEGEGERSTSVNSHLLVEICWKWLRSAANMKETACVQASLGSACSAGWLAGVFTLNGGVPSLEGVPRPWSDSLEETCVAWKAQVMASLTAHEKHWKTAWKRPWTWRSPGHSA